MEVLKNMETDQCTQTSDDEYIKGGLIYCKKCNTERSYNHDGKSYRVICKCQAEQLAKEEEERINRKLKAQIENLREKSFLGKRYRNVNFKNTKTGFNKSFDIAFERAKKYCKNHREVLERGLGIFFHGDVGVGKTHLTACMVNDLSERLQRTLLTNFFEISKEIRKNFSNFQSEANYIDKLSNVDFLFIDDFGTEIVKRKGEDNFLQEKIYEIVNARYNNLKPIIFTSNYSLQELVEQRGVLQKTVDRINEMSGAIIRIDGANYREQKIKKGGFKK